MRFHPTRGLDEPVAEGRRPAARLGGAGRRRDPRRLRAAGRRATTTASPGAMVQVALAPCSPFSVTPELMRATAELAERLDVRLHTHLAEDPDEDTYCLEVYGCRTVEYFEDVGWGSDRSWVAHCVYPNDGRDRPAGRRGAPAWPTARARTMMIGGRRSRRSPSCRAAGVPVGIGCDGSASTDSASLWMEARNALLLGRLRGGPEADAAPATRWRWPPAAAPRCLGRDGRDRAAVASAPSATSVCWPLEGVALRRRPRPTRSRPGCAAARSSPRHTSSPAGSWSRTAPSTAPGRRRHARPPPRRSPAASRPGLTTEPVRGTSATGDGTVTRRTTGRNRRPATCLTCRTPCSPAGGSSIPRPRLDEIADVLVDDGIITAVGPDLADGPTRRRACIDVAGLLVTPGLIDLHVPRLSRPRRLLPPARPGRRRARACPTVVDGGTSGAATFGLARRWIDDPGDQTQVLAFIDPCQIYFATKDFICHKLEIANDLRNLDVDSPRRRSRRNADVIVGMKVRACYTADPTRLAVPRGGQAAGRRHAGHGAPRSLPAHADHPHVVRCSTRCAAATSSPTPSAARRACSTPPARSPRVPRRGRPRRAARHRPLGHRLPLRDARRCSTRASCPTPISTDLNVFNVDPPVCSLAETIIEDLGAGRRPARRHRHGHLDTPPAHPPRASSARSSRAGPAEISVLRIDEGEALPLPTATRRCWSSEAGRRRLLPRGRVAPRRRPGLDGLVA